MQGFRLGWSMWAFLIGTWPGWSAETVEFERDIRPILATRCVKCHGRTDPEGGLNLADSQAARSSREDKPSVIIPGDAAQSELWRRVSSSDPEHRMPPEGPPLTAGEIGRIERWIQAGADWPVHWSLRPLQRPEVPNLTEKSLAGWGRSPVDAFIGQRLQDRGWQPAAPADRALLLRRLSFDLHGLPPTDDELAEFLADESPQAVERLIDRLLSSPRVGERWARHWLDLVHFAETHGHDQDRPRPNAWPYRDYLIRSFNEDLPYGRFIQDQVAGDVLFPDEPQGIVALGLLASGPWDESSLMSIRDDTLDKQIAQYLDRDDILSTVMGSFVSLTVHCARCHDHKFDPITQAEYYGLQAVFAGIDKAERPYDVDPSVARRRRALTADVRRLEQLRNKGRDEFLASELQARAAAWEEQWQTREAAWGVLVPDCVESLNGATLSQLDDGSFLSQGPRPETDTYTATAMVKLPSISGLKLELLADDNLPHRGPGRQDNGNLHLTEIVITYATDDQPDVQHPVKIRSAKSDYDQPGWTIAHAIDGKKETAWGIYPRVGLAHQAVFEFVEPLPAAKGILLTVKLEQNHGRGHLIGRARLAVTSAPAPWPMDTVTLPQEIAQIVARPAESRTPAQRIELARYVQEQDVRKALALLPPPLMVYAGASDFAPEGNFRPATAPRPVHLLHRGNIQQPQDAAVPCGLGCLSEVSGRFEGLPPDREGPRRAALARWLSDPHNDLTWRSMANRIWQHHFGRGLVDTPNDFGALGSTPSHPELLDWLAVELRDSGGSLKHLHRLIVSSACYQQATTHRADYAALDGDNRLLWRMNRRRLDAEEIRDAVLRLNDRLDDRMHGPSVKQFIESPGIHVTPNVDYTSIDPDRPELARRSIYRFIFRTLPDPFLESLDCPDASQWTPVRTESLTGLQALAMQHDLFLIRQSEHLGERLAQITHDPRQRAELLVRWLFQRPIRPEETERLTAYAAQHGWANLCHWLVNANEFLFVE